jgi:hypothetical protein
LDALHQLQEFSAARRNIERRWRLSCGQCGFRPLRSGTAQFRRLPRNFEHFRHGAVAMEHHVTTGRDGGLGAIAERAG